MRVLYNSHLPGSPSRAKIAANQTCSSQPNVYLNYLDFFRGSTGQVLFMSWPKLDVASSSVLGRSTLGGGGYCASTWKMQNSRISPKLSDSSSFINFPCDICAGELSFVSVFAGLWDSDHNNELPKYIWCRS